MPERQLRMIRPHLDDLPELTVPEGYALRTYQPGDEAAWADIMNTGIGSGWTVERCRQDITERPQFRPDALFFVTHENEAVGSACAWADSPHINDIGQLHMVCVKPEHRSKGLGKTVSLAVLHYMKDHSFKEAFLGTDDFRLAAVKAYLDLGFEPDYIEESHRARWARVMADIGLTDAWWRHARPVPSSYQIHETEGNRALLVLVDHTQSEAYDLACRTVITVLNHLDMPYRVLDLGQTREPSQSIMAHQALVFAQERIGDSVPEVLARQFMDAVHAGIGWISFDHRIDRYPDSLLNILPIEELTGIGGTDWVHAPASEHFIVRTHDAPHGHQCRRPVELTCVEKAAQGEVLLETREHIPGLIAGRHGAGGIVQYFFSPKIWDLAYYGHGEGLDDIFWKSVIWAARKPFVMKAMPPFVTIHVSGASGATDGFAWIKPLIDHGWQPSIGVLTEEIHDAEWGAMTELTAAHAVSWFPQALTTRRGIYYHHAAHRPYTDAEEEAAFKQAADKFERHGIPPTRSMMPYHGEYGRNAVARMQAVGVRYLTCSFLPNEAAHETHLNWEPAPYGHPGYILDTLFGHPELFVVTAHPPGRRYDIDAFRYTLEDAFSDCLRLTDTANAGVEHIAEEAVRALRLGLDNRFFGVIDTQEQTIAGLSADTWKQVIERIDALLSDRHIIRVSQDFINDYARSKSRTRFVRAHYDRETDDLQITLSGQASMPLHVQIFDEDCNEHAVALEAFDGRIEKQIRVGEWMG